MTSREKFEAWYLENFGFMEDDHETLFERSPDGDGEKYYRLGVRIAHESWQASESASQQKLTDMAVQLANAESKCRELASEISRRDEIFVPVYPDENTMNRMTDVFHDTAKIHCAEDSIFVDNAELVITAIINHYIKSGDAFLAEVRAQGVDEIAELYFTLAAHEANRNIADSWRESARFARDHAAKLRKGAAL